MHKHSRTAVPVAPHACGEQLLKDTRLDRQVRACVTDRVPARHLVRVAGARQIGTPARTAGRRAASVRTWCVTLAPRRGRGRGALRGHALGAFALGPGALLPLLAAGRARQNRRRLFGATLRTLRLSRSKVLQRLIAALRSDVLKRQLFFAVVAITAEAIVIVTVTLTATAARTGAAVTAAVAVAGPALLRRLKLRISSRVVLARAAHRARWRVLQHSTRGGQASCLDTLCNGRDGTQLVGAPRRVRRRAVLVAAATVTMSARRWARAWPAGPRNVTVMRIFARTIRRAPPLATSPGNSGADPSKSMRGSGTAASACCASVPSPSWFKVYRLGAHRARETTLRICTHTSASLTGHLKVELHAYHACIMAKAL